MKHILPLILVLAALPTPLRAADGDADDKAIRDLAGRYYDALASKDMDALMALWSVKSPDYDARKKTTAEVYAETGPIAVKSLAVVRVRRDGTAASVRVRVELAGNDLKTGKLHAALGKLDRVIDLAREGGGWKVMRYGASDRRLMERLAAAPTKAERLRLLDDDSDLVGSDFVLMILDEGNAQARRGEFDGAARLQEVALEVAEGLGDKSTLGWCHLYQGMSLADQSRHVPAVSSYQKALTLFREANDQEGERGALNNIGIAYCDTGRYAEALRQYQDGLQIERDLKDRAGEGMTLNNIGVVYKDTGRYDEALRQFQDSLQIKQDLKDRAGEAQTLANIGLVYELTGRYAEALRQYQDGLQIARDLKDRAGEARTLNYIGVVYEVTGRYAEALRQFQDSLQIARDLKDRAGEARALNNIGVVYEVTGRYDEALRQYQDSLQIARDLKDRAGEARTLNNIGQVYEVTGRYAEALRQYQDGLQIARDLKDRAGEARTLNNIGTVYVVTGRYAEALRQFQDGLQIKQDLKDRAGEAQTLANIGTVYQTWNHWREAAEAFQEAIRDVEQLRTNTREPSLQTSLLAQKTDPFFRLAQCRLELKQPDQALAAAERMKARGLVDILQQGKADLRRGMNDDERKEEQQLQNQATALGVQLEDLRSRKADADRQAALAGDLDKARQDLEAFRRGLYLHRPDLQTRRAEFTPASLDDLGRSLFAGRPGLVVLSYLVGDDETLLFVLTPGEGDGDPARLTVHRIDVGAKDLAEAVDAFRDSCSDAAKGEPDSDDLYRWLIAPAADELKGAKHVIVVPDGVLHTLPFQALKDPDDKYLIERFSVSYAPSVTALVKMEELGAKRRKDYASRPPSLLAVGISDFGRREKALPAAELEARAVAGSFGEQGRLLLGPEATYGKVGASWGSRRCLHFATHGRLNPDSPLYSSLVLSPDGDEGALYARDLLDADIPAELVVMSACHTGEGRHVAGEGLLGMSWSWFAAGVPSVVASQWSVGDDSTAQLMKVFYARLAAGDSKAEALRQAEWALLNDSSTRHPFYWAPFVLIGDDR